MLANFNKMNTSILGMGVISALGRNLAETEANLYTDNPVLPQLPRRVKTALQLPVFELSYPTPIDNKAGGYTVQLLELAVAESIENAKLTEEVLKNRRVGVIIGTTVAAQLNNIPFYAKLRQNDSSDTSPLARYIEGNPSEYIRRKYKLNGPALTVSNACSSGADAIGLAHIWLNTGVCDLVIAGGADEINLVPIDGFNAIGVCSPEPCRPFDANRTGLNLGEAAGAVVLGMHDKGAEIEIAGFGKTSDAFHITQPEPEGIQLEAAIRNALAQANVSPQDIAFINAHGTGTQANDDVEMKVFQRIFGQIPFMSTKPLTGHTLGAAGAIEAIFTALMLKNEKAAKSHRFATPAPDAPCTPLTKHLPLSNPRFALSTSLAFGGSNTALLLEKI